MKKCRISLITVDGQYFREESHKSFKSIEKARKRLDRFMLSTQIPIYLAYHVCLNKKKHKRWRKSIVEHGLHLEMVR